MSTHLIIGNDTDLFKDEQENKEDNINIVNVNLKMI